MKGFKRQSIESRKSHDGIKERTWDIGREETTIELHLYRMSLLRIDDIFE